MSYDNEDDPDFTWLLFWLCMSMPIGAIAALVLVIGILVIG